MAQARAEALADAAVDSDAFPSERPTGPRERRVMLTVVAVLAGVFLVTAPFARTPLPPIWAFIPVYESVLVMNDLVTAVLLFSQFGVLRSRAVLALASGYLFTALIAGAHLLTFPGLFTPGGLLGAGPQSTAWLYMFWHGGFPLFVIGYAWLERRGGVVRGTAALPISLAASAVLVVGLTALATAGQGLLPTIMRGSHYAPSMTVVVTSTWVLSLVALAVVSRRRPLAVLDCWVMVVMAAWVFDIALSAVLNAGRFDLGFYAGRIYGLLAASFVLVSLLVENGRLYGRLIEAHARTRRRALDREKVSERMVTESDATAMAFIESAAEGILMVDEDGHIAVANRRIQSMFGYEAKELVGQPLEMLLPERFRSRHVGHRAGYVADPRVRGMGQGLDLAGCRRDGTEFPVEISLSYARTSRGVRVMAFITDITERLALERTARQSEKLAALGTLSAGIAHELNNPLGIISSRIELMLLESEDQPLASGVRDDLGVIHRQVQRVARLVGGLLKYARPSGSDRRPIDLNDVVDEVMLLAQRQLGKKGVEIILTLDSSLPRVLGDPSALEQVLLNLITNAEQAIEGSGVIAVITRRASGRSDWVELVVRDSGHGIAPDQLSRIFDPYFTTKSTGTGLGLSITHRIVEEHGGTIWAQSRTGEGTEFFLSFPIAPMTGD